MSLGILCWVAGSPAARAPAHLIGEIPCAPLGTRSREICRLIRAREAASRRGEASDETQMWGDGSGNVGNSPGDWCRSAMMFRFVIESVVGLNL